MARYYLMVVSDAGDVVAEYGHIEQDDDGKEVLCSDVTILEESSILPDGSIGLEQFTPLQEEIFYGVPPVDLIEQIITIMDNAKREIEESEQGPDADEYES